MSEGLTFKVNHQTPDYQTPVTDMEKDIVILAMTRMFTGICIAGIEPVKCSHYQLDREDFLKKGYNHIFFALGLTRLYQGEHWLMVIGLHSAPEYKAEIDFTNL